MLIGLGFLLWLVSVVWFIYLSLKTNTTIASKVVWGIISLFQPVGGIIFFLMKRRGLVPVILAIISLVIYLIAGRPAVVEALRQMHLIN